LNVRTRFLFVCLFFLHLILIFPFLEHVVYLLAQAHGTGAGTEEDMEQGLFHHLVFHQLPLIIIP